MLFSPTEDIERAILCGELCDSCNAFIGAYPPRGEPRYCPECLHAEANAINEEAYHELA